MNLGSIINFTFFLIFLILSGWCSGSPVGCFMWFGGCSASVLILRSRLKAIGRCSKPIRYHFLSFVKSGPFMVVAPFAFNSKYPTI